MTAYSNFSNRGLIKLTVDSNIVEGIETAFVSDGVEGGVLFVNGFSFPVLEVFDETHLRIDIFWGHEGYSDGVPYHIGLMDSKAATGVWANQQLADMIARLSQIDPQIVEAISSHAVRYDIEQTLLSGQKLTARNNINALGLTEAANHYLAKTDAASIYLSKIEAAAKYSKKVLDIKRFQSGTSEFTMSEVPVPVLPSIYYTTGSPTSSLAAIVSATAVAENVVSAAAGMGFYLGNYDGSIFHPVTQGRYVLNSDTGTSNRVIYDTPIMLAVIPASGRRPDIPERNQWTLAPMIYSNYPASTIARMYYVEAILIEYEP